MALNFDMYVYGNFQVIDTLLSKVVKDFSALLVSQGTQVLFTK